MLASFPASMLNQKPSDLGILNRLKLDPSRSSERVASLALSVVVPKIVRQRAGTTKPPPAVA